ncbi:MAG: prolyl oligopeptidase family serine peptidase, partial [Kangiellaceae bacterium]|nr:prolyl oligopeptidase family serine peptidase [Kangiellaceae bacterium]
MPFLNQSHFVCLLISCLLGCGSGSTESEEPESNALPCGTVKQGEQCIALTMADGFTSKRHFILTLPNAETELIPVFIMLHGSGGRADPVADRFNFRQFVEANNYIGLFPNAIVRDDGVSTWNAHDNTYAIPHIDDVQFLNKAIEYVINERNADPQKIYIFGWSNGGFMANRFACESPQSVSAVFSLAGNIRGDLAHCDDSKFVAIHHIHATGDNVVPIAGDDQKGYMPAQRAIEMWSLVNQCDTITSSFGPFDLT